MTGMRLHARDFKTPRHRGRASSGRWRDIGIGLAAGLAIALVVYVKDRRLPPAPPATAVPAPRANVPDAKAAADEPDAAVAKYDFYDMLPKFEVVVPEKERDVRRDQPAVKIDRPGTYVLQAGSYRTPEDAERVRSQLGKQGITATVQRVAVDADVWHRVRIGPLDNLDQLNRVRTQLRKADIDALVIRVGD
jgi:cell division protein FtsN